MINDLHKKQLQKWVNTFFLQNNLDPKTFDIDSEIDRSLTYEENKSLLREKLRKLFNVYSNVSVMKRKEAEIMPVEQVEIYTAEIKKKNEDQARLEFEEIIKDIKETKTTDILDEIYKIPKQYAKMVIKGYAKGLLVYGDAGLGKSFNIQKAIAEEGITPNVISGHITPLKLFEYLYNHRKDHIIFDDVNLLSNITNLNMFKACLEEPRNVSYHSSTNKLNIPSTFKFEGSVILLVNSKPESNEDLKAVESRILTYELDFNYETKIKLMYEIAKIRNYPIEIVDFIKDNTSPATKDFNLRKLNAIVDMYRFDKDNWKSMVIDFLIKDFDTELIITLLKKNPSIKAAQREYTEITGSHRATFYRHKAKINATSRNQVA